MNDDKLLKIAEKLLERTQAGEIPWSETVDFNTYSAAFPDYSVTIRELSSSYDRYKFSVFNEKGTEVESTRGEGVDILELLFESARRQALKSDEILDDLLTRLSGDG